MKKYKVIMFDFDGVICRSEDAIIYAQQQTFKHFNRPIPDIKTILSMIEQSPGLIESFIFLDNSLANESSDTMKQYTDFYRNNYKNEAYKKAPLYPGIKDILHTLLQTDVSLVIASNKSLESLEIGLKHYNMYKLFCCIAAETIHNCTKPSPKYFELGIAPHFKNIDKSEYLMIGDTLTDLHFAKNLGIDSMWASYGYGEKTSCLEINPTYVINQPSDILNYVK